jgi:hypothetical protein
MALIQVLVFLLLCSVVLGWLSRRAGAPYPIALVVGGGALSFIPGLPQLEYDPQFLLVLVLPPILYQAALLTSWRDFKANLRPIGMLAIGLVIVTTLAVGATLKFLIPDIPWAAGLRVRRHRLAAGRGRRHRHPVAPQHAAAHRGGAGGREPRQRRLRAGALQARGGRG